MDQNFHTALNLHQYLIARHWDGQALMGPDPGIRFNYRIGRFIKSYLRHLAWNDNLCYLQAQGYWVLGNWFLFKRTGEAIYREIALRCSEYMMMQQRDDGAWDYPNPEWKGRVATCEGTWGSLGLLETYRQTAESAFLDGALQWHKFLVESIGFQCSDDEMAVNYFAHREGPRVPNNSAFVLRFLAELADVRRDKAYLQPCAGLLTFMQHVQKTTGEFPYAVVGKSGGKNRQHFQCYQYNAFQSLDLMRYHEITGDATALPLIIRVLDFLRGGLAKDGYAFYECGDWHRQVAYHTAVLGAAFAKAGQMGIDGYRDLANRTYSYLLGLRRSDGSFSYSRRDYRLLCDQRSYPRYLAMILYHLLLHDPVIEPNVADQDEAHLGMRSRDNTHIGVITTMKKGLDHFVSRELHIYTAQGFSVSLFPTRYQPGLYNAREEWRLHRWHPIKVVLSQFSSFLRAPIRYLRLLRQALATRALADFALAWYFARYMVDVDVIYATFGDHKLFVGYFCKQILAKPLAVMIHAYELYQNPNPCLFIRALSACDQIITVTEFNREFLAAQYRIDASKIKVVRYSVDIEDYRPARKFVVLIVAFFAERKGHEVLFKAIQQLAQGDIEVWVVGDEGTERAVDVRGLAVQLGIESQVVFFGGLSGNALKAVYRACDVFCLPCRRDSEGVAEGFPNVLIEAMAFGKPVITTRHVEIPRIIDEILVDENDVQALAQAIRQAYQSAALRERLGKKNRKIAEELFSTRNAKRTAGILRDLVEQRAE